MRYQTSSIPHSLVALQASSRAFIVTTTTLVTTVELKVVESVGLDAPELVVVEVGRRPSLKVNAGILTKDENGGGLPKNIEAALKIASDLIVERT